jgi:hypothetical protein
MDDEDGRGQTLSRIQESGQRGEAPDAHGGMSTSSLSRAQRNSQNEAREIKDKTQSSGCADSSTAQKTSSCADYLNSYSDYLDTFDHPPVCVLIYSDSSLIYYSPFSSSNLHLLAEKIPSQTQLVMREFRGQKGEHK